MKRTLLFFGFIILVISVPYIYPLIMKQSSTVEKADNKDYNASNSDHNKNNKKTMEQNPIDLYYDFIFHNPNLPVLGNALGNKVIVHIVDYLCPYCNKSSAMLERLVKRDPEVKIIIINSPILSEKSRELARVSLNFFAIYPNDFAAMNKKLNSFREEGLDLEKIMEDEGLSYEKYKEAFDKQKLDKIIDYSIIAVRKIGMKTVPSYIIKDKFYGESMTLTGMEIALEKHYGEN